MQTMKSGSWVRMILAFAAILIVGGAGMALAGGPTAGYAPQSSVIIGSSTVLHGATSNYVLQVTFTNGSTADYGTTSGGTFLAGATFSTVVGTINPSTGVYTAPAAGPKDKISGTFTQLNVTTSASRFIQLQ